MKRIRLTDCIRISSGTRIFNKNVCPPNRWHFLLHFSRTPPFSSLGRLKVSGNCLCFTSSTKAMRVPKAGTEDAWQKRRGCAQAAIG